MFDSRDYVEMRERCLEYAIRTNSVSNLNTDDLLKVAQKFYKFVMKNEQENGNS